MSNAIAKLDSAAISEAVTPRVTIEEAEKAFAVAYPKLASNLLKWQASKKVGEYLGYDVHGAIMADSFITRDGLDKLRNTALKMLDSKNIKTQEVGGKLYIECGRLHCLMAEVESKIGEIIALRNTKLGAIDNAPQIGAKQPDVRLHGDHVYVHIGDVGAKIERPPVPIKSE